MVDQPSGDPAQRTTITISADGWFQAVSPSFLTLIGRPIEALAGTNLVDFVHPHDAAAARRLLSEAAAGTQVTHTDLRMFTAGEQWQPIRVTVRGIGDGRVILDAVPMQAVPPTGQATTGAPGVSGASGVSGVAATPTLSSEIDTGPDPFTTPAVQPAAESQVAQAPMSDLAAAPAASSPDGAVRHGYDIVDVPGPQVAARRAAVREQFGAQNTPMIEIDSNGHTTFVSGDWDSVTISSQEADEVVDHEATLEQILESSGQPDAIGAAIGAAFDGDTPPAIPVQLAAIGVRFIHAVAIPSPDVAGVSNALVVISLTAERVPMPDMPLGIAPAVPSSKAASSAVAAAVTRPAGVSAATATAATATAATGTAATGTAAAATTGASTAGVGALGAATSAAGAVDSGAGGVAASAAGVVDSSATAASAVAAADSDASPDRPNTTAGAVAAPTSTAPTSTAPTSTNGLAAIPGSATPDGSEVATPAGVSMAERMERVQGWLAARGLTVYQFAAAVGVFVFALLLRTWDLVGVPTGFHGDEAVTGEEAQRILENGGSLFIGLLVAIGGIWAYRSRDSMAWKVGGIVAVIAAFFFVTAGSIGVYSGSALGQPTAPFYLYAVAVQIFGPTVWGTRIMAALAGAIAVALTYFIVQRRFDHRIALASAFAMATMTWSIHFSRIAFGLAWWPVIILLATAAIDRATKERTGVTWFIAGGLSVFGVYVYNSHWSFGLCVAVFIAIWLTSKMRELKTLRLDRMLLGPVGALVVGIPMLSYAFGDNGYFNHFTLVSRRSTPEWTDVGVFGKLSAFLGWYIDSWENLLVNPISDGADASGIVKQVPYIFSILALIGIVEVVRRHRTAFTGMLITTLLVLPVVPSFTTDGLTRRDFGIAPAVAILAGIGAIAVIDLVKDRVSAEGERPMALALVALALLAGVMPYFTDFRNAEGQRWIFAEELMTSIDVVETAEEDGPVFVNWYSVRHGYGYETLRYLLDGTPGAERTPVGEFVPDPTLELTQGVAGDQLYIFIGDYANNVAELQALYPEGRVVYEQPTPRLVAVEIPVPAG